MGKHKNIPVNCFSYKADVGSDSLALFTICQQVLDSVFVWIHKEPFIREERVLAYLDSHGRPWVEETAKHLHITLPLSFQRELNLDSPEEVLSVIGWVPENIVSFGPLLTGE